MEDFDDPNTWAELPATRNVYLDDRAQEFVVVDAEDFHFAIQWKWCLNKPHSTRNGRKRYARRSQACGGNYKPPLYLHVEIMKRTGIMQPSPNHTIVDHIDGNEFNARRSNLRWATPSMNRKNLYGAALNDPAHAPTLFAFS